MNILSLLISALSQGMIYAPMALGVFIAFRILNTPDLTIDGSFVAGMCVCAVVTITGHPYLALLCGMVTGALAGLVTGLLQTKLRINPILSGILTMTGLYTINFMMLGGQSNLYLQRTVVNSAGAETQVASDTMYKTFRNFLVQLTGNRRLDNNLSVLIITGLIVLAVAVILSVFFFTRPGMAIRATGDNEEMVRSSSINADMSRIQGIMLSNDRRPEIQCLQHSVFQCNYTGGYSCLSCNTSIPVRRRVFACGHTPDEQDCVFLNQRQASPVRGSVNVTVKILPSSEAVSCPPVCSAS